MDLPVLRRPGDVFLEGHFDPEAEALTLLYW